MSESRIYEDGKYCMQDTGNLYIGCKYSIAELIEDEEIPFKFRLMSERYLFDKNDPEDTLETALYYLEKTDFHTKIYKQLRAKVKILILQEKGGAKRYVTKQIPVQDLTALSFEQKEKMGLIVQELAISKLALMAF